MADEPAASADITESQPEAKAIASSIDGESADNDEAETEVEDEDDGEDEDDDDDDDDEEDEPKLKYARMTSNLTAVYRNGDATSAFLVAGDKMVFIP
jgi:hypothetical protein